MPARVKTLFQEEEDERLRARLFSLWWALAHVATLYYMAAAWVGDNLGARP